ncbi:MAG: M56 family metallopeptidase [Terracidiphilus sp.]
MDGVSIIVTYLINAVWLVTVVAAAGWLAALCLKRLGPQAEHIGWVVTLEIAIVAPAAPLLRQLPVLSGNQLFNVGHSSTVTVTATYASAGFGGLYQLPVPALWTITALYFAVVLFCATRFAWLLYATRRMVENAHPLELTPEQKENWNRCKHLFEVDRILLASSAAIHAPVVLELREAILVLPDGFAERCTLPDLMTALAHECAHASRATSRRTSAMRPWVSFLHSIQPRGLSKPRLRRHARWFATAWLRSAFSIRAPMQSYYCGLPPWSPIRRGPPPLTPSEFSMPTFWRNES